MAIAVFTLFIMKVSWNLLCMDYYIHCNMYNNMMMVMICWAHSGTEKIKFLFLLLGLLSAPKIFNALEDALE